MTAEAQPQPPAPPRVVPVRTERQDDVTVVTLDRPPVNAIGRALARELAALLDVIEHDESVCAVVLTGSGASFSAGLDVKELPQQMAGDGPAVMAELVNRLLLALYGLRCPVVAAVNGHAVAGGLVLALATDERLCTSDACQLGLAEGRVGVGYPVAAMEVCRAELGPAAARRLILRGQDVTPEEALALGIVDGLHPPDHLLDAAVVRARELAAQPAANYARVKRHLREAPLRAMEEALRDGDPRRHSWLESLV
ncbi:MAG: enoyl-CoA hydratase/isomerase family protein [Gemmatimonadota bacterium]